MGEVVDGIDDGASVQELRPLDGVDVDRDERCGDGLLGRSASESADYVAGMKPTDGAICAGAVLELATLRG